MPELPEVEMVRRSLEPNVIGKCISSSQSLHKKYESTAASINNLVTNIPIAAITRRGKLLIISFKNTDLHVTIHLKMTGQLLWQKNTTLSGGGHTLSTSDLQLPSKHSRLVIVLDDGSKLYFNDQRLFGYIRIVNTKELATILSTYGIEPGLPNFTLAAFTNVLQNKKTSIKALLLNQTRIAGLGNIYVDEACFIAKIMPNRLVATLSKPDIKRLHKACDYVIATALRYGGTTFYSFLDGTGEKGNFKDFLQVFAREKLPCPICKTPIQKIKHAGRGTHFCATCQK